MLSPEGKQRRKSPTIKSSRAHYSSSGTNTNSFREGLIAFRPLIKPFAKVFLGALFTYQVVYWTWLRLETYEVKAEKKKEISLLEEQARQLAQRRSNGEK